tara:strand:- start:536 stop:1069 length:534 start_codon:yes stop_codon:yes gene_type:complete
MKVNENHKGNLLMLEELCSQGQRIHYHLFSKACITLEESDFDLAISLCNQYKKKHIAQEYEVMKEEYFADFLQEVDPPCWMDFGDTLGKSLGYRKRNKYDVRCAVRKQFEPKDVAQSRLFAHIEDYVVDPFRNYCNSLYRKEDAGKHYLSLTKDTEPLRESLFKDGDNFIDLMRGAI